jgi:hypothetical protein
VRKDKKKRKIGRNRNSQEKSLASLIMREILCSAPEFKIAMISDDFEGLG